MKEKMQPGSWSPRYAVPWLLSALVWQLGLYFLAKLLTDGRFHYDLSIFLDDKIPFVPLFMLIYWGGVFLLGNKLYPGRPRKSGPLPPLHYR